MEVIRQAIQNNPVEDYLVHHVNSAFQRWRGEQGWRRRVLAGGWDEEMPVIAVTEDCATAERPEEPYTPEDHIKASFVEVKGDVVEMTEFIMTELLAKGEANPLSIAGRSSGSSSGSVNWFHLPSNNMVVSCSGTDAMRKSNQG